MDRFLEDRIEEYWQEDAVGVAAGVSATKAAPPEATDVHFVTGIQCSGDAAALVTIESPAATILYRKRFTAAFVMSEEFAPGVMAGAPGAAILVKVSASTANSEANIQGARRGG